MNNITPLQALRLQYKPPIPSLLQNLLTLVAKEEKEQRNQDQEDLKKLFPNTCNQPIVHFSKGEESRKTQPFRIGIVFSGGQAPGGHNVVWGAYDALKQLNSENVLIGFLDGPEGIIKNKTIEIEENLLKFYRNQGGFDLLGSGRTKIETEEQFLAVEKTIKNLNLQGLIIVGGDDSNTNAAFLAEFFLQKKIKTRVIGVPKTIDGDLKNEFIELSFGFDTATKTYAESIGNSLRDAVSAKKYYFFIRLMGRSASHIALECAMQTQPNLTIIGEEVFNKKLSLSDIVNQIADMISARAKKGKNYGGVLIPEGLIEFIPEFKEMIEELNDLLTKTHSKTLELVDSDPASKVALLTQHLSPQSLACFNRLTDKIKQQLVLDRDPHGNIQVSKIETERLLIDLVEIELQKRAVAGEYKGKFSPVPLFFGYEGRSGLPSNFDCKYCYTLGLGAVLLVSMHYTGYMCCIRNLSEKEENWEIVGIPIYQMLHFEKRGGKNKAVIRKAYVDLDSQIFRIFDAQRKKWMLEDHFLCPGPIQFAGPKDLSDICCKTLIMGNNRNV